MPAHIKVRYSSGDTGEAAARKKKGKCKEGEGSLENDEERKTLSENRLATLDIFAGCGGLSEGLHESGNINYTSINMKVKIYCKCII